ncbi:MAG: recombinase family protein [Syntrophorhabdus sp.]|nr:recombinase family protein [Syntrophorhabdus sp.]
MSDTSLKEGSTRTKGQHIGYVRVSSVEQNTNRQLEGVELDRTFTDRASGKDTRRPALEELLRFVREGDVVIVHSIDRLARNLPDLRRIVEDLTGRGIQLRFVKENLTFSGDDSPMSTLLLSVMGAFAEFERALIRERQAEGIAAAKRRGVYKGRKKALSREQAEELKERVRNGERKSALAKAFRISRETLYRYLAT